MHPVHILADPAVQQAARYIPMTAKDKTTAIQAGLVAGAVTGLGLIVRFARGGSRKSAASK